MAGEQSEFIRAFLNGNAGPESKYAAQDLTSLRILRTEQGTDAFDEFMASCIRLYQNTVCTVTKLKEGD